MNIRHAAAAMVLLAALAGSSSGATAQDQDGADWSGFYLGVDAGVAWGTSQSSNSTLTTDGTSPTLPSVAATYAGADRTVDLLGTAAGAQLGYLVRAGDLAVGIEADYQWSGTTGTDAFLGSPAGPAYEIENALTGFGTVRGRVGYPLGRLLPYLTAGVAVAQTSGTVTVRVGTLPSGRAFTASDSRTVWGYAVGAGLEAELDDHWRVRGEVLHLGFGTQPYTFDLQSGGVLTSRSDATLSANTVRLGLSYRF